MGTYLHIVAPDATLEQIADAPTGTCEKIRPIYDAYTTVLMDPSHPYDDNDFIDHYEASIAALHPNAPLLRDLMHGDAFGKVQAFEAIENAGLDRHCDQVMVGAPKGRALATEILGIQRRRWGRRSVIRMDLAEHRVDYARLTTTQRRICARTITAVREGAVETVCWS